MARKTAEDLRNLVKSVRDKSYPYERREEKGRNWHDYDNAQVNEIADVLDTIRDAVDMGIIQDTGREERTWKAICSIF
jgi:hypothetical protein